MGKRREITVQVKGMLCGRPFFQYMYPASVTSSLAVFSISLHLPLFTSTSSSLCSSRSLLSHSPLLVWVKSKFLPHLH